MAKISPTSIITLFVMLVIGASLVGTVGVTVWQAQNGTGVSNVTGASAAILGLLTLFFVIIVVMIAVRHIRS